MMIPEDRHSTVWSWILMKGNALNRDEEMTDFAHQKILDASWDCLRSSHDLMGRTTRDLPAPYIRASIAVINLHLLFETLHAGFYWAILQKETKGEIWLQPGMYLSIFYLLSYTSIFSLLFVVYSPSVEKKMTSIVTLAVFCCTASNRYGTHKTSNF